VRPSHLRARIVVAAGAYFAAGACVTTAVSPGGAVGSGSAPKGVLVEVAAGSVDPPAKAPAEPWESDGRVCVRSSDTSSPKERLGCGSRPTATGYGRYVDFSFDESFTAVERRRRPGACCYEREYYAVEGRPLRTILGDAVLAPLASSFAWACAGSASPEALPFAGALSDELRCRLGALWAQRAAAEHASVAEFARLANTLLALRAPHSLVRGAHAAAQDEVGHAADAYALASALTGSAQGPARLPLSLARPSPRSRAELVAQTVLEGCIGETLASVEARASANRASCGATRGAFERVAAEEADHAVLAFEVVSWAIATASEAERDGIRSSLRELVLLVDRLAGAELAPALDAPSADSELCAFGELTPDEKRRAHALAARELLRPALSVWEAALGRTGAPAVLAEPAA
jgi:hypothetical protein